MQKTNNQLIPITFWYLYVVYSNHRYCSGQTQDVDMYFLGYAKTTQTTCLSLMAEKIAVSQSTSGDMPEIGLEVLNQSDDSIEEALAKQLINP